MGKRQAICIVIDGLRASALGTYGNTTSPTPNFDRLAGRSLVADWLWANSPELADFYRGVWDCSHALRSQENDISTGVLNTLQKKGVQQWLITDEPWLIEKSAALPFDDELLIETEAKQSSEDIESTTLAQLFSEVIERLAEWREDNTQQDTDGLIWLHAKGLTGPWDAPLEMRADLLDEEDPAAAEFVDPPTIITNVDDPDTLLTYRVAYQAQVAVVDACVGALYQAVEETADSETMVVVMGSRGLALGEHGSIGTECGSLYCEQLHLPLMMNLGGNSTPISRLSGLIEPADLGASLLNWFAGGSASSHKDGQSLLGGMQQLEASTRSLTISGNTKGNYSVRTPAWMMQLNAGTETTDREETIELFSKPDDRWEHNDVAVRCPEIVDQLRCELERFLKCNQAGEPLPIEPITSELIASIR